MTRVGAQVPSSGEKRASAGIVDLAHGAEAMALEQALKPRFDALETVVVMQRAQPAQPMPQLSGIQFPGMQVDHAGLAGALGDRERAVDEAEGQQPQVAAGRPPASDARGPAA